MPRLLPLIVVAALATPAGAADPGSVEFFEAKIRPALAEHCYPCHSADAKPPKAGLRLDTRAGLRSGGDSGPAIVPGKPGESLLVKAVRRADEAIGVILETIRTSGRGDKTAVIVTADHGGRDKDEPGSLLALGATACGCRYMADQGRDDQEHLATDSHASGRR